MEIHQWLCYAKPATLKDDPEKWDLKFLSKKNIDCVSGWYNLPSKEWNLLLADIKSKKSLSKSATRLLLERLADLYKKDVKVRLPLNVLLALDIEEDYYSTAYLTESLAHEVDFYGKSFNNLKWSEVFAKTGLIKALHVLVRAPSVIHFLKSILFNPKPKSNANFVDQLKQEIVKQVLVENSAIAKDLVFHSAKSLSTFWGVTQDMLLSYRSSFKEALPALKFFRTHASKEQLHALIKSDTFSKKLHTKGFLDKDVSVAYLVSLYERCPGICFITKEMAEFYTNYKKFVVRLYQSSDLTSAHKALELFEGEAEKAIEYFSGSDVRSNNDLDSYLAYELSNLNTALLREAKNRNLKPFEEVAFVYYAVRNYVFDLCLDFEKAANTAKLVKGWYDLAKVLPIEWKWRLHMLRSKKKEPDAQAFYAKDICIDFGPMAQFNPYSAKHGFSVQTFLELCNFFKLNPYKVVDRQNRKKIPEVTTKKLLAKLAWLYGADVKSAISAVSSKQTITADKKHKPMKLSPFEALTQITNFHLYERVLELPTSLIGMWRPYFIKWPRLLNKLSYLKENCILDPKKSYSQEDLIQKLSINNYENVPEHLGLHMAHAMENDWEQEIVDEFVEFCAKPVKSQEIPQVSVEVNGVTAKCLSAGDPVALYIGELSGCCQHINEGAGADAAAQAFTESWCDTLTIKSKSGTLLAQSFIWQDKNVVVLDSVESVLDDTCPELHRHIVPTLIAWVKAMNKVKKTVCISTTDYGLTSEIVAKLQSMKSVKLSSFKTPGAWHNLNYSDCESDYVLKIVV